MLGASRNGPCGGHECDYPPAPTFTGKDVPSQRGRVFIVTGRNADIGFELCKLLYATSATIYMASRSQFLQLDLNDLHSVKSTAAAFARQESRLDVLWNQACLGPKAVEPWTKTAHGLDVYIGAHCVTALLFAELLLPQLRNAVALTTAMPGSVRMDRLDGTGNGTRDYSVSKAGNWILGIEFARRHGGGSDGILSIVQNPGNLNTSPVLGGYTELFAGLSPELTLEGHQGAYVIPWGRVHNESTLLREDIVFGAKPGAEGGQGLGERFWEVRGMIVCITALRTKKSVRWRKREPQ
ncbi:hypothetical protein B0H63DRAFT_502183 [Podospora didyma]|uniref:NAD(P)-binding protein n=1 Tax=Podospora didyma TaxID=330526 RepID=A0AAE0TWG8_9PEZI|nr:hypothetical protein B0H63DRAFT_502183 [Podospora didyma]